jgi:hypothetical protein
VQGLEKRATARKTGTAKGAATRDVNEHDALQLAEATGQGARAHGWCTTPPSHGSRGLSRAPRPCAVPCAVRTCAAQLQAGYTVVREVAAATREAGGGGHGAGRGDVHAWRVLDLVAASLSFNCKFLTFYLSPSPYG